MFFRAAEQVDPDSLQNFLKKHEHTCVTLCSIVRRNASNVFVFMKSEGEIWGVLHMDLSISYCLPFLKNPSEEFEKLFLLVAAESGFFGPSAVKKISCIDGEKLAGEIILSILMKYGFKIFARTEYFLMTKEDVSELPPPASLLSMGEEIVCCKAEHAEELYDLQFHYLKEEVSPKGRDFTDLYVKSSIKSILKNQKVFAIESDGKFVAKVNTNAIGWNWVQIGGVYTDPLYRRNGYSLCLLSTLCRRINKTGRKSVLFVKKNNLPALALYEKLDFKKSCDFQITYFE